MSANAATANSGPLPHPKAGAEPSMEEILASIRRIIADDNLGKKNEEPAQAAAAPTPAPEPDPDDDILDLAEMATVAAEPEMVSFDDIIINDPEPEPEPVEMELPAPVMVVPGKLVSPIVPPQPVQTVEALEDRILTQETGSLVGQAFASLSRNTPMPAPGRSLEDVMVEMLKPMLREWMDSHLPGIVERIVKAEVERVSRG